MNYVLAFLAVGAIVGIKYLFFYDVMNKIQYIERFRIYWITKDVVDPNAPKFGRAIMRQTSAPYWRGEGWSIRFKHHTFQFGRLTSHVDSLEAQIGNGWYDYLAKELRKWERPA